MAWDKTKPADNRKWNLAAGDIRDNNAAIEAVIGEIQLNYSDLSTAITDIGTDDAVLRITASETISADLTIPENVTLVIESGAVLTVSSSKTLTINGYLVANAYQIFDGGGVVVFGKSVASGFLVEWWGGLSDDTVDNSAPLQLLEAAITNVGGRIVFQSGTYKFQNPVYFDSTVKQIRYIFQGQGDSTQIHMDGANLDSDYLLYLNQTSLGATASDFTGRKYYFSDFLVIGDETKALYHSFALIDESSLTIERVEFRYCLYGVHAENFCDNMAFRDINWNVPTGIGDPVTTASYFYYQNSGGDGHTFDNVAGTAFNISNGMARLKSSRATTFRSCLTPVSWLDDCYGISYVGCSWETNKSQPGVTVINSSVTIDSCRLWSYFRNPSDTPDMNFPTEADQYTIFINDDSETEDESHVTVQNCTWSTPNFSALSHKTKPEIWIESAKFRTQVTLKNNRAGMKIDAFENQMTGIEVGALDGDLSTVLGNSMGRLSSSVNIIYNGDAWQVADSNGQDIIDYPILQNPTIFEITQRDAEPKSDLLESTEYFYRIATYNERGNSNVSAEVSDTTDLTANKTGALQLKMFTESTYVKTRVWRGTISDTYTHYVDIPTLSGSSFVYDRGENLSGHLWLTASVPAVPTFNSSQSFTDTDATPSVFGGNVWQTTGTTTITDFDDGVVGQELTIIATGSITITDGTNLTLAGNFAMTVGDVLKLVSLDGTEWLETSRSVN